MPYRDQSSSLIGRQQRFTASAPPRLTSRHVLPVSYRDQSSSIIGRQQRFTASAPPRLTSRHILPVPYFDQSSSLVGRQQCFIALAPTRLTSRHVLPVPIAGTKLISLLANGCQAATQSEEHHTQPQPESNCPRTSRSAILECFVLWAHIDAKKRFGFHLFSSARSA
jgi:hypothetical protein